MKDFNRLKMCFFVGQYFDLNMIKTLYKFLSPKYQNVYLDYKVDVSPRYGHEKLVRLELLAITQSEYIYIPYDYPQFMCDRFYSEQYGLAMYLLANSEKYQPLFANYYVSENKELANIIADFWKHENTKNVEKHGGSFWLRIN